MELEERVKELQELTDDYFKTAELLDITYDQVRNICEEVKQMALITCECGNTFLGWEDKEDTCPDCLMWLINPPLEVYEVE